MIFAVIDSQGLVTNTIEWDGNANWQPPEGCVIAPIENGGIGWSYVDGAFVPPKPPAEAPAESVEALAPVIEALPPSTEE